ncbi:unnamed protein product, partial [Symbiodinium pilosum]
SSGKSASSDYNTTSLNGWHDDLDGLVYQAALDVFHKNLAEFNASHAGCRQCYSDAGRAHLYLSAS